MAWLLANFVGCDLGHLSNFSYFQNRTKFTYDEFVEYGSAYALLQCRQTVDIGNAGVLSFAVSGFVGFVAYVFMFFTLKRIQISECTLIYHRSIVVMELFHMLIMWQNGILQYTPVRNAVPNSWLWIFWLGQLTCGWRIGDQLKLAIGTLTAFLTMERFIAVWFPTKFDKFNRKVIAYSAVALSIFVSTAHTWQIFLIAVAYNDESKQYVSVATWFSTTAFSNFIGNVIYGLKVGLSVLIFSCCILTIIRLHVEGKKIVQLQRSDAKNEMAAKRRACTLAFILGVTILFDHTIWVAYKIIRAQILDNAGDWAVLNTSYERAMSQLRFRLVVGVSELVQRLGAEIVHSYRFFMYLAFNKTMREGFVRLIKTRTNNSVSVVANDFVTKSRG